MTHLRMSMFDKKSGGGGVSATVTGIDSASAMAKCSEFDSVHYLKCTNSLIKQQYSSARSGLSILAVIPRHFQNQTIVIKLFNSSNIPAKTKQDNKEKSQNHSDQSSIHVK